MMGQYSCDADNGDSVFGLGYLGCWYCTSVGLWLVVSLVIELVFFGIWFCLFRLVVDFKFKGKVTELPLQGINFLPFCDFTEFTHQSRMTPI
jgi:hypothetical protein